MAILDFFHDLLHLDIPPVCDSYEAALRSISKYLPQRARSFFSRCVHLLCLDPTWNLSTVEEGYTYVASEGEAKLSRLSSTRSVRRSLDTNEVLLEEIFSFLISIYLFVLYFDRLSVDRTCLIATWH